MKPRLVPVLLALVLAWSACELAGAYAGQAMDDWTRQYSLAPGGIVEIGNTNGRVDVLATDGSAVEVRAERIVRATTDARARELLSRLRIDENATADRVSVRTQAVNGFMSGADFEVRYHVRAPKGATIQARTTNGAVAITGFSGSVVARTTNGSLRASALEGAVDARTTNGSVEIEMAAVTGDRIALRTTNGRVLLMLPSAAGARLSASWTNGRIDLADLPLTVRSMSRRRFEGQLNGGGIPIDLQTTNGSIRVRTGA